MEMTKTAWIAGLGLSVVACVSGSGGGPQAGEPLERSSTHGLLHETWMLEEIGEEKLEAFEGGSQPYLEFKAGTGQLLGYTGCNQLRGGYDTQGESGLAIHAGPFTRRGCFESNPEGRMMRGLAATVHYRLEGSQLALFDAEERELLRFQKRD